MSEAAWRLVLAGGAGAAALLAAAAARWRHRASLRSASATLDLSGVAGRLILFTSAPCRSCDAARARLEAAGVAFREIRHADESRVHEAAGVAAVPLIVARSAGGVEAGRIAGKPSKRALRGLLRAAGLL
ncbi:MAG: hypothetical protein KQH83_06895 [Actinobacteria bacterium]|nr:hypothetical protein [Actinomycetota bacterium]